MNAGVVWLKFAAAAVSVCPRRVLHGPLRPSWSWCHEMSVEFLRRYTRHLSALPVSQARQRWELLARPSAVAKRVVVRPVDLRGLRGSFCASANEAAPRVMVYFHGGAYVHGSLALYRELMDRLALAARARVLGVEYRLAPEHPFPAAVEDALKTWRWLMDSGVHPGRVVLGGDSAGGGLALALLCQLRDEGAPLPAGAALLSPWVDLTARGESQTANAGFDWAEPEDFERWAKHYLGGAAPATPLASPGLAPLTGLPRLLVQVGEAETLLDQVVAFAGQARSQGVDVTLERWPDMVHNWHTMALVCPAGTRAIESVGKFAQACTP